MDEYFDEVRLAKIGLMGSNLEGALKGVSILMDRCYNNVA
jgi:hypothetical protein